MLYVLTSVQTPEKCTVEWWVPQDKKKERGTEASHRHNGTARWSKKFGGSVAQLSDYTQSNT